MRYIPLFILIQLVSLVLAIIGIPVCAALAYLQCAKPRDGKWHWPRWAWIWDNDQEGTMPDWYGVVHPHWSLERREFHWTALRNPCNNLRYVPGVSKVGRPLWRATWTLWGRRYYAQAGWNGAGYPVLSAGINIYDD